MNSRTEEELKKISMSVPKELINKTYRKSVDSEAVAMNEYMNKLASGTKNKRLQKRIKMANLPEQVDIVDKKAEKELDLWFKTKTEQYIKSHRKEFEENKRNYEKFLKEHRII